MWSAWCSRRAGRRISTSRTGSAGPEVVDAVRANADFVAREVLAESISFDGPPSGFEGEVGDGERVYVTVNRAR